MKRQWITSGSTFEEHIGYSRAVVVDKDNTPNWSPADLAGVSEADLDALFAPLPAGDEWTPLS